MSIIEIDHLNLKCFSGIGSWSFTVKIGTQGYKF